MERKNQIFSMIEPRENLKNSIVGMIKKEEMKKTRYNMVFSSVLSLASVSMAIFFVINIVKDAYQSGLSEYLSLLFSDGALLATYWQTYVMSVVESLPIIPITIVVASVSVFIWSINKATEDFRSTKSVFYKIN